MNNTGIKKLYINKVTLEDLELGSGKVTQIRNNQLVTLSKIDLSSSIKKQIFTTLDGISSFEIIGGYDPINSDNIVVLKNGIELLNNVEVDVSSGTHIVFPAPLTSSDESVVFKYFICDANFVPSGIVKSVENREELRLHSGTLGNTVLQKDINLEYKWVEPQLNDNGITIINVEGNATGSWKALNKRAINVKWAGAKGDGITDDTNAIALAVQVAEEENKRPYYPKGIYVATDFHRKVGALHYGDYSYWKVNGELIPIPLETDTTFADMSIYVDENGSDEIGNGLSVETAYKTIQYAYDSLPENIKHQCKIKLGDGNFAENYLTPTYDSSNIQYLKKAMLFARGKNIAPRTQRATSGDMVGGVVISGNGKANTKVGLSDSFDYGIYNMDGQIALENFTIHNDLTNYPANVIGSLLVSHRGKSYLHCNNVDLDGEDKVYTKYAAYCESGGQIEYTGNGDIKNCSLGVTTLTAGDTISLSDDIQISDCNTGVLALNNSKIGITNTNGSARGIKVYNCSDFGLHGLMGATITIKGYDGNFRADETKAVSIYSPIKMELEASLSAIWSRLDEDAIVNAINSSIELNNSDFQRQVVLKDSYLRLLSANSYVAPNASNTDAKPIVLIGNSNYSADTTTNIVSDEGISRNMIDNSVISDDSELVLYSTSTIYRMKGDSAHRVGCYLPTTYTDTGNDIEIGAIVNIYNNSWGVEFDSSKASMGTFTSFSIGNSAGQYTGCSFMFNGTTWELINIGLIN